MMDRFSFKGSWALFCDNEIAPFACSTGIKTVSNALRELPKKFPDLFPAPPKSKKIKEKAILNVYTSNDTEEGIKRSAEAIRSNVDYPMFMLYFKKGDFKQPLYKHSPDNELYKCITDTSEFLKWQLISKESNLSTTVEKLPSQVTDRDQIHLPAKEEEFKKVTNRKGGKWMLQFSDWKSLDDGWKNLIRLYDAGILVGLKTFTDQSSVAEMNPDYGNPAIMCYTADADLKSSVKSAAESIFICTGYNILMYYKTNEASHEGKYRHEGSKAVAKYLYTETGKMYERDYLKRWRKCYFKEESKE